MVTAAISQIFSMPLTRLYTGENSWICVDLWREYLREYLTPVGSDIPCRLKCQPGNIYCRWLLTGVWCVWKSQEKMIDTIRARCSELGRDYLSVCWVSDSRWLNVLCEMMWCDVTQNIICCSRPTLAYFRYTGQVQGSSISWFLPRLSRPDRKLNTSSKLLVIS